MPELCDVIPLNANVLDADARQWFTRTNSPESSVIFRVTCRSSRDWCSDHKCRETGTISPKLNLGIGFSCGGFCDPTCSSGIKPLPR